MRDPEDRARYGGALLALGVNCRQEITDAHMALFWTFLADLTIEDFERAVGLHMQASRFFPTIAELRERVTPAVNFTAEAVLALQRVIATGVHDATVGTRWTIRRVAELVGPVAAEAFAAAGGSSAFEHEQSERNLPFLRKRFVEAYVAAAVDLRAGRPLALSSIGQTIGPGDTRLRELVASTAKALQASR